MARDEHNLVRQLWLDSILLWFDCRADVGVPNWALAQLPRTNYIPPVSCASGSDCCWRVWITICPQMVKSDPSLLTHALAAILDTAQTNVDNYWDWELPPPQQHFQGDYFFFHVRQAIGPTLTDPERAELHVDLSAMFLWRVLSLDVMAFAAHRG
eukprot:COSAG02_NODE_6941_length_3275_cov_1.655542_1_plen_155_part_00